MKGPIVGLETGAVGVGVEDVDVDVLVVRVERVELEDEAPELVVEDCGFGVENEDEDEVVCWLVLVGAVLPPTALELLPPLT